MNMRLILGSVLAAQVVLALGLMWQGQIRAGGHEAEPWLNFAGSDVSKIVVADSSNTTTLELKDGQWSFRDSALPANTAKITTFLSTLEGLKTTWPVVSTAAGRERFEVTEDKHQRRLSLFKDNTLLGDYYFGTSPGFRQTHARRAEDDEVYALAFNNFDLPADSNDWLDKALLSAKEPVAIKGPDYALIKTGDTWQFDNGAGTVTPAAQEPESETATAPELTARDGAAGTSQHRTTGEVSTAPALNADAAKKLADAFVNLHVLRVADVVPAGEPVVLEVKTGDTSLTYRFTKVNNNYYVQRSDRTQVFTLTETDYKAIAEQNPARLSAAATAEAAGNFGVERDADIVPTDTTEQIPLAQKTLVQ